MQKYKNTKARMVLCSSKKNTNVKQQNKGIHKKNYQTNYQVDTPTNNYFISRKEESNNFMWYYRQYSASSIER